MLLDERGSSSSVEEISGVRSGRALRVGASFIAFVTWLVWILFKMFKIIKSEVASVRVIVIWGKIACLEILLSNSFLKFQVKLGLICLGGKGNL